jgi:O-antigen/teichoic acid export membrane protein
MNIVISFGIPMAFLIFLMADPVVMLLAGKGLTSSIFVIQVMAPVILIVGFGQIFALLILSANRKDREMIWLSLIGMLLSLIINLVFIPYFAEKATAFSQLLAELLVTLTGYFLARRCLDFHFPAKKFLLNVLCVIPFVLITYLVTRFLHNNFLQLALSGVFCGMYFIYYQYCLIKDTFIRELIQPYMVKFTNTRN